MASRIINSDVEAVVADHPVELPLPRGTNPPTRGPNKPKPSTSKTAEQWAAELAQRVDNASSMHTPVPAAAAPGAVVLDRVDEWMKFTEPQQDMLIDWMSKGYTVRRIHIRCASEGFQLIPSARMIVGLLHDDTILALIKARRDGEAQPTMQFGLSQTEERIRRLTEQAEALEVAMEAQAVPNLKYMEQYRRTLAQIQSEAEGAGIKSTVPGDDKWLIILQNLQRVAQTQTPALSAPPPTPE